MRVVIPGLFTIFSRFKIVLAQFMLSAPVRKPRTCSLIPFSIISWVISLANVWTHQGVLLPNIVVLTSSVSTLTLWSLLLSVGFVFEGSNVLLRKILSIIGLKSYIISSIIVYFIKNVKFFKVL